MNPERVWYEDGEAWDFKFDDRSQETFVNTSLDTSHQRHYTLCSVSV